MYIGSSRCVPQLLVSGGVDSTVCAALLHKALSQDQVIAVHIDNGFMRKHESLQVEQSLRKIGLKLRGECVCSGACGRSAHTFLASHLEMSILQ